MKTTLRVLHLEDSATDGELVQTALRREEFDCEFVRVIDEAAFRHALAAQDFDVILADHTLPSFDGVTALQIAVETSPETPFLFVSGTMGEELAIDCLKAGATDYVLKDRLGRIGPAVRRAIEETRVKSEKRHAEAAIRKQAQLLDLANDTIMVRGLDDTISYWNKGAERLYGWTADEAIGRNAHELLSSEFPKPLDEVRGYFMRHGSWQGEVMQRKRDGKPVTVWSRWACQRDPDASPVGILEISNDITSRLELESQFLHAQKMETVGRLASGVARDFDNLLTLIIGRSQFVMGSLASDDRLRPEIDLIQKTAERASTLTRQLLAFSRKQIIRPRLVDLNALVTNMDRLLRRMIGEGIDLVTSLAADVGHVNADPGQLEQVTMNLVVNARDAMPKGGRLTIETARTELDLKYVARQMAVKPGVYAMLAVSDTGEGMDAETQSHVFEPFFTTRQMGAGLGLSTVYGIVKQCGGNIWIYSQPGKGSTFKIYLPVAEEVAISTLPPAFDPIKLEGNETVLVVKDDEVVRKVLRDTLKTYGYTVVDAPNSAEGLAIAAGREREIHLLVTDVVMPSMDGLELAATISKVRPGLPTLYMSGHNDAAVVRDGILKGGMDFIKKPFTQLEFARKVREILDRSR